MLIQKSIRNLYLYIERIVITIIYWHLGVISMH